jgi:hypothetical protein
MSTQSYRNGLWDSGSGRFNGVRLRHEMMMRAWLVGDLVREAGISRTTAYKVLRGHGVLHKTALKVLLALKGSDCILPDVD